MTQSVRQEHGVGTCLYCFLCITLGKTEFLHAVEEQAADTKVNICPFYTRFGYLECIVVASLYDGVDFQLALTELTAHWHGAGIV